MHRKIFLALLMFITLSCRPQQNNDIANNNTKRTNADTTKVQDDIAKVNFSTIKVHSKAMQRDIACTVILPENYDTASKYPTVYLLHGYGDDETAWITKQPRLSELSTQLQIIIVCPNGEKSWYFDSPINPKIRFETFISKEVVNYMDSHYSTYREPKKRAITGLSMGGHGALWNAFRHQDVFGWCGSMSGGVDIRPFANKWSINQVLGMYNSHRKIWESHTVISQVDNIHTELGIIIDCGTEDFFFNVNQNLHKALTQRNIKHNYSTRPGNHSWNFWKTSIINHLLFFSKGFGNQRTPKPQIAA